MYTCPKCNGEMIQSYLDSSVFNLKKTPSKFLGNTSSDILSCVCSNCGYVELYAKNSNVFKQE